MIKPFKRHLVHPTEQTNDEYHHFLEYLIEANNQNTVLKKKKYNNN